MSKPVCEDRAALLFVVITGVIVFLGSVLSVPVGGLLMARDINITAACAHCGEVLDTNELTRDDIDDGGELDLSEISLHVGTEHVCFQFVSEIAGDPFNLKEK